MTSHRTSFISALLGAGLVALVVVVLALTGVIDRTKTVRVPTAPTQVTTSDSPAPASEPRSVASIYQKVSPGVVFVSARGGNGQLGFNGPGGGRAASGSGFVIAGSGLAAVM